MLSAVSQQVQTIQEALQSQKENKKKGSLVIELVGKQVKVSQDMAIFITMNSGYAGRSNLPDNLKKLFRSLAMTSPDGQLIADEGGLAAHAVDDADALPVAAVPPPVATRTSARKQTAVTKQHAVSDALAVAINAITLTDDDEEEPTFSASQKKANVAAAQRKGGRPRMQTRAAKTAKTAATAAPSATPASLIASSPKAAAPKRATTVPSSPFDSPFASLAFDGGSSLELDAYVTAREQFSL